MAHVEGEIEINRPVEEVFDFVADERNEPRYNPRMRVSEKITYGPIGVGTKFRAEVRGQGIRTEMTVEITGYERPRRLALVTKVAAIDVRGSLTFEPSPAGTRMRWSWDLEGHG